MIRADNLRRTTYRLYPTPKQVAALELLLASHQQLYNAALEERISAWRKAGRSISYQDQCASLTTIRRDEEMAQDWATVNCSSQQMTLRKLDKSFASFFRRVKAGQTPGFPRFKSFARYPGFSFKSHGDGWRFAPKANWKHGSLRLSGVGQIDARGKARQGGEIRASEILRRQGHWYLSLTLAVEQIQREREGQGAMAYDWGVETFLTSVDHAGEVHTLDNPRWWQSSKDQVVKCQQAVSRKPNKASKRRKKAVARLARAKAKGARKRNDWAHQQTARLARQYALVATEELALPNMTRSAKGTVDKPGSNVAQKAGLNREILDTAPGLFTSLFRYKVQETGGEWVDAPTRKLKPSQRCPQCWSLAKKELSQRVHRCEACGHAEPRDVASARVVLRWALETHGQELTDTGTADTRETLSFASA